MNTTANDLRTELATILNRASAENESNTPDWVLAHFLYDCLEAFDNAVNRRDVWFGIAPAPGAPFARKAGTEPKP